MRKRSTKNNVNHIIKYGILPGVCFFVVVKLIPDILGETGIMTWQTAEAYFWVLSVVFFGVMALAMMVMGIVIVLKIRVHRQILGGRGEFNVNRGRRREEEQTLGVFLVTTKTAFLPVICLYSVNTSPL